jgi:DNA-binding Xre family transcriptional regulator
MIRLKIREFAEKQGVSRARLGHLTFVDEVRMRKLWKFGDSKHTNFTLETLDRFAQALQVDASELIESVPDSEVCAERDPSS